MNQTAVLQEVVRRIVEAAHPERIILFGSAARDDADPDSDIDLLIVKSNVHRRRLAMDLYEVLADIARPIDLIVVTPEDIDQYGQSPGLVLEPALREGIELHAA